MNNDLIKLIDFKNYLVSNFVGQYNKPLGFFQTLHIQNCFLRKGEKEIKIGDIIFDLKKPFQTLIKK